MGRPCGLQGDRSARWFGGRKSGERRECAVSTGASADGGLGPRGRRLPGPCARPGFVRVRRGHEECEALVSHTGSQPKGEGGRLGPRPPRTVTPPQSARSALKLWTGGCGRGSRPSRGARAGRCCLGVRLGLRGPWEGDGAPLGPRAQGRRGKAGFSAEAKGSCTPPVPLPWAGLGRARPPGRRGRPRHAPGACSDPRHSCRRNADGALPAGAGLCSA